MARIGTAGLIVLTIVGILLGVIVILLGALLAVSPGKAKSFLDEKGHVLAGSISEKIHVNINGVQQGMFIMGKNVGNPVLLFVHGGTAMPEYFLTLDRLLVGSPECRTFFQCQCATRDLDSGAINS
jgi:hypothetical protein